MSGSESDEANGSAYLIFLLDHMCNHLEWHSKKKAIAPVYPSPIKGS